ncbi:hypothetical protein BGW38_000042 [Lunasporangiospora selenospora]|uniref:Uncharacterized protein n=1 Tax=Lunasporangiospora selenospora TaxID=979761 RepID=A0A9P6FXK2_9FUNG|nr:hypothetical protein BGW38_000042 [Lunasporangiospora selenospora]
MALLGTVAGFATFGIAARGLGLSIQRQPLTSGLAGYGASAAALGAFGYYIHHLEQRQNEILNDRKQVLTANRARRLAAEEATA